MASSARQWFLVALTAGAWSACSSSSSPGTAAGDGGVPDVGTSGQDASPATDSGSLEAGSDAGGSTTGSGTLTGTVNGQSLAVVDGEFNYIGSPSFILDIQLASVKGFCTAIQGLPGDGTLASTSILELGLVMPNQMLSTGTFPLAATGNMSPSIAYFTAVGATCNFLVGPSYTSTSGTVTVTSTQPNVVGTFDITFGSDQITGSFNVGACMFTPPVYDGGVDCVQP